VPVIDFEGRHVEFREGDSIAAALYRSGLRTFSRSFKYHRRRGLYCLTGDCPNCLVSVDDEPAVRSCCTPARHRQRVTRENAWPSADVDVMASAWYLRWLLPVGFYYKTMIRPWFWRLGEPVLRRAAGLGDVPRHLAAADRVAVHHHADLFVAGGGVAGLSAALAAADSGERVVLAEEGGFGEKISPGPVRERIDGLVATLRARPTVTLLERAAAIGIYEGPLVPVVGEGRTHTVHPGRIVVATGAVEQHAVFPGNDLPGVWLGRGAARMAGVHGVAPGTRALLVGNTAESVEHAAALLAAGVELAAVVAPAGLADRFPTGTRVIRDGRVVQARGRNRVHAAVVESDAGRETIRCDALVCALGLEPRAGLLRQVVEELVIGAGEVVRPGCSLDEAMASGRAAGSGVGGDVAATTAPVATPDSGFVCLCEDVQTKDFEDAWNEGYQSTELLKRYTTATMGPCQGGICHAHMRAFVAARTSEPSFTGSTTARPPARPIKVEDAAAGLRYVVENRTALHDRHLDMGASMAWFGAWKRPNHYGDERAEYDAVRHNVSIMDVGTLGKFFITGPDATAFLERLYPTRVQTIKAGRLKYSLLLNEAGYVFDDGLICSLGAEGYYVTFTTAGAEQGEAWLKDWAETWGLRVHIVNQSSAVGAINVTGPRVRELLARLSDDPIGPDDFLFASHRSITVAGIPCRALRLGFVGELSFELHHPSSRSIELWNALLEAGQPMGLRPHGVRSLLLLRLEKGHVVIGMDTDFDTTPARLDAGWAVKMNKEYFVGRAALARLADDPVDKKLHGIVFPGTSAPLEGTTLTVGGDYVGMLSSSRFSPVLGQGVALGWLRRHRGEFPTTVSAEGLPGRVTSLPFYDPKGERLRG
jgi:sarcosine oxidase subunit alpha